MDEDADAEVNIGMHTVLKEDGFIYLGSMIQGNREIDDDISHNIRIGS